MGIFKDIKNLLAGLGITSKHLTRHAITLQYPEEKMEMPERSRGIVVLLSDKETGKLNCTACELCARACPTGAIMIKQHRDENKKKVLDAFVIDNTLCCFCGLCEESCNFDAIKMATKYEFSTTTKEDLIWDVKKLQEMGLDVPYTPKPKKKPKPKPKPKPKTEGDAKPAADAKPRADKPAEDKAEAKPVEKKEETATPEAPKQAEGEADSKPKTTEVEEEAKADPAQSETKTEPEDGPKKGEENE